MLQLQREALSAYRAQALKASPSAPAPPADPVPLLSASPYKQKCLLLKASRKRRSRFPAVRGPYLLPPLELAENPFEALVHVVELQREGGRLSEQQAAPGSRPGSQPEGVWHWLPAQSSPCCGLLLVATSPCVSSYPKSWSRVCSSSF